MPKELEKRQGQATVTVHIDVDHQAVKAMMEEGYKTVEALMQLTAESLIKEVQAKDTVDLDSSQSYDITFKMHLLDTARGVEPPAYKDKVALLLNDD